MKIGGYKMSDIYGNKRLSDYAEWIVVLLLTKLAKREGNNNSFANWTSIVVHPLPRLCHICYKIHKTIFIIPNWDQATALSALHCYDAVKQFSS